MIRNVYSWNLALATIQSTGRTVVPSLDSALKLLIVSGAGRSATSLCVIYEVFDGWCVCVCVLGGVLVVGNAAL